MILYVFLSWCNLCVSLLIANKGVNYIMSRKRSNREGTINQRKDGRWEAKYSIDGKRKSIYAKTQKEVRALLKQKLKELEEAEAKGCKNYLEKSKTTFGEWLDIWLEDFCRTTVRASTYSWYETFVRVHIKPSLGNYKMCDLTSEHLQQLLNAKKRTPGNESAESTLSNRSIDGLKRVLRASLHQARIHGYMLANIMEGVKTERIDDEEIHCLSKEQHIKLHQTAKKWQKEWPAAFSVLVSLYTGMRKGEILGLRWCDVSLDPVRPYIHVKHTLSRHKNMDKNSDKKTVRELCPTKTKRSKRIIPIVTELYKDFVEYEKSQIELKSKHGIEHKETDFVFQSNAFKEFEPRRFYDKYCKILEDAGISEADFHTLRHTFATRATELSMDINSLSSVLGHAKKSTTVNMYCHDFEEQKELSMKRIFYINSDILENGNDNNYSRNHLTVV